VSDQGILANNVTDDFQLPTYNITINDTQPLFYYCSAPGSCIENGMVGAINPVSSHPSLPRDYHTNIS